MRRYFDGLLAERLPHAVFMRWKVLALSAAVLSTEPIAAAQLSTDSANAFIPPPVPPLAQESFERVEPPDWYGWQILMLGAASYAIMLPPLFAPSTDVAYLSTPLGIGGCVLGAPAVHWAHGRL